MTIPKRTKKHTSANLNFPSTLAATSPFTAGVGLVALAAVVCDAMLRGKGY